MNQRIIAALAHFGCPVAPDAYSGSAEQYFVFNYSVYPVDFSDDAPHHERYLIQIHYFCPRDHNSLARRGAIKAALFTAGFSWPDEINATNATNDYQTAALRQQHYVFECEAIEEAGHGEV